MSKLTVCCFQLVEVKMLRVWLAVASLFTRLLKSDFEPQQMKGSWEQKQQSVSLLSTMMFCIH